MWQGKQQEKAAGCWKEKKKTLRSDKNSSLNLRKKPIGRGERRLGDGETKRRGKERARLR